MSASRPWLKLKAGYHNDDEFVDLSPMAELLFIRTLSDCKARRCGGIVTAKTITRLCRDMGQPGHPLADELVTEGLWTLHENDSFQIAGWSKWQTDVAESRRTGRAGGLKSAHRRGAHKAQPNPGCELCSIDLSRETEVPPLEPPLNPPSTTPQQTEKETEKETEMSESSKGERNVHPPSPSALPLEIIDLDHHTQTPTAEIMAAYVRARRRITGAQRWEPKPSDQSRLQHQARQVLEEYGGDSTLIVGALDLADSSLHPSVTKPLTETGQRMNLPRAIGALLAETRNRHRPASAMTKGERNVQVVNTLLAEPERFEQFNQLADALMPTAPKELGR